MFRSIHWQRVFTWHRAMKNTSHISRISTEISGTRELCLQERLLNQPLINLWALKIGQLLFGTSFSLSEYYRFEPTMDIDNMFAFKGKGSLRIVGAYFRDIKNLDWSTWRFRTSVLFGFKRDPYDTFRKQRNWCKKYGIKCATLLLSKFGPNDRNVSPYSTDAAVKLRELADWAEVGIHPSYAWIVKKRRFVKNAIAWKLYCVAVAHSQHYLKMKMPATFRTLVNLGIENDHSMGYAKKQGIARALLYRTRSMT